MTGSDSTSTGSDESGRRIAAGTLVGGGRYRLVSRHGGVSGLQFWRATDTTLERDVAVTIVPPDPEIDGPDLSRGASVLERTLRLGRIDSPGLARVLDVVDAEDDRVVIAEWTTGKSLRETAENAPSAEAAGRAVQSLASAAESAHRRGNVLSIDHPDRIRVNERGDAVLAFPAIQPDTDQRADLHGLGAVLYALLTAHWPDHGADEFGGLPAAERKDDGSPVSPRSVRPEVPYAISDLAERTLDTGKGGVRTAATIVYVLDRALDPEAAAAAGPRPVAVPATGQAKSGLSAGAKLGIACAAIAALVLFGVAALASSWNSDSPSPAGSERKVTTSAPTSARTTVPAAPAAAPRTTTEPAPAQVEAPVAEEPVAPPPRAPRPEPAPAPAPAPPPPAPEPAPAPPPPASDVLPCYPGYVHTPPPDGPCYADPGGQAPAPAPAPAPVPNNPSPNVLPCYPGYVHTPPPDGPCLAP